MGEIEVTLAVEMVLQALVVVVRLLLDMVVSNVHVHVHVLKIHAHGGLSIGQARRAKQWRLRLRLRLRQQLRRRRRQVGVLATHAPSIDALAGARWLVLVLVLVSALALALMGGRTREMIGSSGRLELVCSVQQHCGGLRGVERTLQST